jgi:hypothetical protein
VGRGESPDWYIPVQHIETNGISGPSVTVLVVMVTTLFVRS